MTEWRLFRGWTSAELRERIDRLRFVRRNFDADEDMMTGEHGWHHYHSEAVIAHEPDGDVFFERARVAVANYRFSNPRIVLAHFDPGTGLLGRRILLEIQVLGLHYLCSAVVVRVRDEPLVYGFRYDTLEGHIERGMEWFLLTKDERGDIRFRIEARWRAGEFPNWWSRVGFSLLSGFYQRRWHRHAHRRLALLARYGSPAPPPRDAAGLAHQGVDVTFTYHTKRTMDVMRTAALNQALALGALTGIRSMAGPAILGWRRGGLWQRVLSTLAAGEMGIDKTSLVGPRTDPLPLAGRVVMGAAAGGYVASEAKADVLLGALAGAAAAFAAAHLAYRLRQRLPVSSPVGGVIEDAVVVGLGGWLASRRR